MKRIRAHYKNKYHQVLATVFHARNVPKYGEFDTLDDYLMFYDSQVVLYPYKKKYQILAMVIDDTLFDGDGNPIEVLNFVKRELQKVGVFV